MKDLQQLYQEYWKLLSTQDFTGSIPDDSVLEKHIQLLKLLSSVGNSAISVFDLNKKDHVFISDNYSTLFGYDLEVASREGWSYFDKDYHPEDLYLLLEAGIYFIKMGFRLPVETVRDYKLVYDYRRRNKDGIYIRVIEQQNVLELDNRNQVWLALSVLDISPDQDVSSPFRCRLIHSKTGTLFHFPPVAEISPLSNREVEILSLISKGLISKQIADRLYISVNTVNTHRQRIIEKLKVANTAQAIQYAGKIGLIA
ncbi:MAG: LuxR C-terminal-related transcriptional regulator [Bacteroidales bacterium]